MTTVTPLRVAVLGQGYVGLPLSMKAVAAGHDVIGIDASTERVKRLAAGDSFVEDVPRVALEAALRSGRYAVTDDALACEGFDVAVVTVPTPLHEGAPDLSYIESAARMLAPHVRPDSLVVLESTTYPGTTEQLFVPILEAGSGLIAGIDFGVGYSPERIDPGNPTWDLESTPSSSPASTRSRWTAPTRSTRRSSGPPCGSSTCRAAELAKLLENTFRHVNMALVNELAMFAHDLDIDVWEAIDAAATKPFGFMRFTPGPGVGGHCLPIDPSYLSWTVRQRLGRSFRFVELANDINDHMPDYVASRLMRALNKQRRRAVPGQGAGARPGVQAQRRRRPGVARGGADQPADRRRGRGRRGRPARGRRMPIDALTRRVALDGAGADAGGRGGAGDRPRRLRLRPGDRARSRWCWTPGTGWTVPMSSSSSRPSIAVILSGWPRVSESFALNEVLALHRAGLLAAVLALKTGDGGTPHPAAAQLAPMVEILPPGIGSDPVAAQAEAAVSRLDGIGVSAVHGYFAHAPAAVAAAVADKFGVPYGFSVHALDARKVSKDELGDRARRAAVVVTCNEDAGAEVEAAGISPTLVRHGVDLAAFPATRPAEHDPVELLAVGRLVEKKGFDVLLEALSRLDRPYRLRLVGDGPLRPRLEAMIAARRLADRVELVGRCTHATLPDYYAGRGRRRGAVGGRLHRRPGRAAQRRAGEHGQPAPGGGQRGRGDPGRGPGRRHRHAGAAARPGGAGRRAGRAHRRARPPGRARPGRAADRGDRVRPRPPDRRVLPGAGAGVWLSTRLATPSGTSSRATRASPSCSSPARSGGWSSSACRCGCSCSSRPTRPSTTPWSTGSRPPRHICRRPRRSRV